jgi:hypothetical protein
VSGAVPEEALVQVRLLNVPLLVLASSREHHDGLMREFRLMALSDKVSGGSVPSRLAELTQVLGTRYADSSAQPNAAVDEAHARGERSVDLLYRVAPHIADSARALEALMAQADEFCDAEQLITLGRTPLMRRFANWYLQQFIQQVAGCPAVARDGPDEP